MRSGEEIQKYLTKLGKKWADYNGTEKSEAQTFLNQLFDAYGSDRIEVGAQFEAFKSSAGFMDLHWPGVCIIEMKAPHVDVSSAREQVKKYWEESADESSDTPAAQWVVLCNFKRFEIWEPGRFPKAPRTTFALEDLPSRYDALMFLAGTDQQPNFAELHKELTAEAANQVGDVYLSLIDRSAAPPDEIIRFIMQSVWTMFAEELGLLDGSPFKKTVAQAAKTPEESAQKLGFLFRVLNQKGNQHRKGILAGTRFVNGQLFADPAEIELNHDELALLAEASGYDWGKVEPTIFGSLMERIIAGKLGAHYTHEADIMKIVTPTIIRPWQERIDAATTPSEAAQVLDDLCAFTVLDRFIMRNFGVSRDTVDCERSGLRHVVRPPAAAWSTSHRVRATRSQPRIAFGRPAVPSSVSPNPPGLGRLRGWAVAANAPRCIGRRPRTRELRLSTRPEVPRP